MTGSAIPHIGARLTVLTGLAGLAYALATPLGGDRVVTAALFGIVLVLAVICAWAARNNDSRQAALERVSRADPLTGCLNRRGFEERLRAELDAGMRTGRRLGLVVLDLDDFKAVNDTRGHAAGDDLLRWTVERASSQLRPMDSLGRLGGDEFAVLIPGAGPDEAREVAQRLANAIRARASVSTGVASFPSNGADRDSLLRHADVDLYAAKHGRAGGKQPIWATALARAADLKTSVPDEHSAAVAHYAGVIAERLGWSGDSLELLHVAAVLHDVGKVAVPHSILSKPGPLTPHEYDQVKDHAVAGAEIVDRIDGLSPIVDWIRYSHEHIDGSGYPEGLHGEEIPLASRILLVADAFDAMTSNRPYGSPLPPDGALQELRTHVGRHFDRRCVRELEAHLDAARAPVPV